MHSAPNLQSVGFLATMNNEGSGAFEARLNNKDMTELWQTKVCIPPPQTAAISLRHLSQGPESHTIWHFSMFAASNCSNCYLTLTPSFRHRSAEVGQAQVEAFVNEVLFCLSLRPVSKQIGSLGVLILFTHCLCVVCFYHSVLHAKVISQQASENLSHKALIQRGRI